MAYATIEDLEARWRPLTSTEEDRAETLLGDAAVRLDVECLPSDPPTEAELNARLIVSCEMVKRAIGMPTDGPMVENYQETTGPFSNSGKFLNPYGDLYLTKNDRRLLGCGGQVAFTIPLATWDDES